MPLEGTLLNPIEAALGFSAVWNNGQMYYALTHDSQWLETCKGQIDRIRVLYDKQAKTKASDKP